MPEDVLVIGAGPAGITSAYYLEQAGISYRVVDRAHVVAATWEGLYPSLRLNTASIVSNLPGRKMPLGFGWYALGRDYYRYLDQYVKDHGFNIHLGVEVYRVTPEGDGWRVESSEGTAWYSCVIVATGRFGNPYLPDIPGHEGFTGRYLHASAFKDPADFAGERVLVVGNGPSGGDISVALTESAQQPVLLAIRSDIVIARSYPWGLPAWVWLVLKRFVPKRWHRAYINKVMYQSYPGIDQLDLPLAPNRDDRVGTSAPIRGADFPRAVAAGTVRAVAGLAKLDEHCAELMDGSRYEVDAVIMCTGYRPVLNYLDIPYDVDDLGWPRRDEGMQVADAPGLYLVGRFYRGWGPMYNMKVEAQTALKQIQARLAGQSHTRQPQLVETLD